MTSAADLSGKVAIITGASRGIGYGIAEELVRRGAAVTISSRKEDQITAAGEQLRKEADGARVLALAANSGHDEDRADVVRRTMAEFGSIDILINNTGINPIYGPLADADLGAVRKIFDTNVVAALGFVQLVLRAWMNEHGGSIVNVASVGGLRSTGVLGVYGASKAALIRLTEELAWQLGPKIRVNAVAPATVKTKFAEMLYQDREEEAAAAYPMKRLGTSEDVAQLVAFLVSDQASWITGETVRIDGGLLATGSLG
jgi:NAD(P)-dependent dehydrogenase (short-subunit alcohol dehydrogenase family)